MSDLDAELLLAVTLYSDGVSSNPDVLREIRQAFTDAGYVQLDQEQLNFFVQQQHELMRLKVTPTPQHIYYKDDIPTGESLMTGRTWYKRFAKGLDDVEARLVIHNKTATKAEILNVAKVAAGLTQPEQGLSTREARDE